MLLKRQGGNGTEIDLCKKSTNKMEKLEIVNFNPASKWYKDNNLLQKFIWLCFFHNMLQKYLKQLRT